MAENYGPIAVVLDEDINRASRKITESRKEDDLRPSGLLGSALNQWRRPITDFEDRDHLLLADLKASPCIGEIDFGRKEWARARDAVDAVMELLQKEMRAKAARSYEHLRIDSYIRQGSSRDGLKVIKPDEFDSVIEFISRDCSCQKNPFTRIENTFQVSATFKWNKVAMYYKKCIQSYGRNMYFKKTDMDLLILVLESCIKEYLSP